MALQTVFGPPEIQRLKDVLEDGVRTLVEIESLKLGMSDTITAVAEELQLPAKLLRKVISSAHKGNLQEMETELSDVEQLLKLAGK